MKMRINLLVLILRCTLAFATVALAKHSPVKEEQELTCDAPGSCVGQVLDLVLVESTTDCLKECKNSEGCMWYTFDSAISLCFLFEDCSAIDTDCVSCVSGEVDCLQEVTWSKLMIISGFPDSVYGDVELIDLSSASETCIKPPNFPGRRGQIAAYIEGKPMVCGGDTSQGVYANTCFFYSKDTNSWDVAPSMNDARWMPAGVLVNETTWWLAGGSPFGSNLQTTEIYTESGIWKHYVDMPKAESGHCILQVNDTHFIMVGGTAEQGEQTYMFDMSTEIWTRLDDASLKRMFPTCGVITRENGEKEIVLAGGQSDADATTYLSSEIFSLKSLTWRTGPNLPYFATMAFGLQYGPTFVAVGGFPLEEDIYYSTILKYDHVNVGWVELEQHLENARGVYTAVLVPDEAVNCS